MFFTMTLVGEENGLEKLAYIYNVLETYSDERKEKLGKFLILYGYKVYSLCYKQAYKF